jgi:hypothetical protein
LIILLFTNSLAEAVKELKIFLVIATTVAITIWVVVLIIELNNYLKEKP